MADAILALTANLAMAKKERIEFNNPDWFDGDKLDAVPVSKDGTKAGEEWKKKD